jgi:hypothetical protein
VNEVAERMGGRKINLQAKLFWRKNNIKQFLVVRKQWSGVLAKQEIQTAVRANILWE